jgi:hypothetical protein
MPTPVKVMFYTKLKTYKAKDLHPNCEVVKKKKVDKAVKEINRILFDYKWDLEQIMSRVSRSLSKLTAK